jgi:hypothetical protein
MALQQHALNACRLLLWGAQVWGQRTSHHQEQVAIGSSVALDMDCHFKLICQLVIRLHRWLHHTSLLWDFQPQLMRLLKQPARQPKYRQVGHCI